MLIHLKEGYMKKIDNNHNTLTHSIPIASLDDSIILWLDQHCIDDWAWQWDPGVVTKRLYFKNYEDLIYFRLNHA